MLACHLLAPTARVTRRPRALHLFNPTHGQRRESIDAPPRNAQPRGGPTGCGQVGFSDAGYITPYLPQAV
jgi:hypothetical protein